MMTEVDPLLPLTDRTVQVDADIRVMALPR